MKQIPICNFPTVIYKKINKSFKEKVNVISKNLHCTFLESI